MIKDRIKGIIRIIMIIIKIILIIRSILFTFMFMANKKRGFKIIFITNNYMDNNKDKYISFLFQIKSLNKDEKDLLAVIIIIVLFLLL